MSAKAKHNTINKRFLSYKNECRRTAERIKCLKRVSLEMEKRDARIKQKTMISYKAELAPEVASAVS